MNRFLALLVGFALLFPSPPRAQAHGDVHGQILELTKEIEKNPRNAELYLRRGELSRTHGDWDGAQADYDRTAALDPQMHIVDLARGRMFLEAGWPVSSKVTLDRFLARFPDHVEALITRARTLVKLGQRLDAVKDYTRSLGLTAEPKPEIFLERAQALMAEGNAHFAEALRGLDEGMQKLGPLVTLQLYAIDLEVKQQRFDAALARLDKVAAQSPRKETWLARRGEILRTAGREADARAAFQAALAAMDKLPPARRHVPAMQELEKRLRAALETGKDGAVTNAVAGPAAAAAR